MIIKKIVMGIGYLISVPVLFLVILVIYCEYQTQKFNTTPTYRTNRKRFVKLDTAEVYILGTTHSPGKKINADSLYNTLEIIKPDVILFEYDSTGFDKNMNLKRYYSYILPTFLAGYQSNEGTAVRKYITLNKNAVVRPYEWNLRDKWHKEHGLLTIPDQVFDSLDTLYRQKKLSEKQRELLTTYYDLTSQLEKYADSTIVQINTTRQDSICRMRQNYQYHKIKEIVDQNNALTGFRNFYRVNEKHWDIRNKAMSKNIRNYIKLFPQQRLVVLTGFYHRYYLRQELGPAQKPLAFKLLDLDDII